MIGAGSGASTAHIAFLTIDLIVPHSASLKDKRRVVKSLKDRLRARFNASVAEIDYLDDWQHCRLGVTMISNDRQHLDRNLSALDNLVSEFTPIRLVDSRVEWL